MKRASIAGSLAVLTLASCGSGGQTTNQIQGAERPEYVAVAGAWDYYFRDLPEMAATADVVIAGTAVSAAPGLASGEEEPGVPDPGPQLRVRNVTLVVDEVYKGSLTPGTEVVLEQDGYNRAGAPYEMEEVPWSEIGDEGIYFLYHPPGRPDMHFRQLHPDARLLIEGDKVVSFSNTPLGEQMSNLRPDELPAAVRAAIAEAHERGLAPQEKFAVTDRPSVERGLHEREREAPLEEPGPPTPEGN